MDSTQPKANANGRILVVDDQPANIKTLGGLLGKLGFEIIPALDGDQALKRLGVCRPDLILLDVLMDGFDGFEVCRRIRADAEWAEITIIFLSAADDKEFTIRAFAVGGTDYVTKPFNRAELVSRVRTHLALKFARDRMKQLAEDKDELIGILAHDCNNHLGGIGMTAQLIRSRAEALGDGRLQQMAESVEQASGRMLAYLKEFLSNAAAEHGLVKESQVMRLKPTLSGLVHRHQESARRKQLKLRLDAGDEDTSVEADPAAMDQVLDNLLSNAIKFSPLGKQIVVGVRDAGNEVECYISDQGPGFSEEDRRLLFRRYAVLDATQANTDQVTAETKAREQDLQDDIALTLEDLKSAPTDAEVQKQAAKLTALNGQLSQVEAARRREVDAVTLQKIANDARLEQERLAAAELAAKDDSLANQRVTAFMKTIKVRQK